MTASKILFLDSKALGDPTADVRALFAVLARDYQFILLSPHSEEGCSFSPCRDDGSQQYPFGGSSFKGILFYPPRAEASLLGFLSREIGASAENSLIVSDDISLFPADSADSILRLYLLTQRGRLNWDQLALKYLVFHTLEDGLNWAVSHPRLWQDLEDQLSQGAQTLRSGGLTAFATETVYGLGADALNSQAAAQIFKAKKRPASDPLIVHISRREQLEPLISRMPPLAEELMKRWWPGPLTLVFPKSSAVPEVVSAGHPTVAVRMPRHPLALELISRAGVPVAAPSANLFGRTSPTTAAHVAQQLGDSCDVILDAGACRVGVESTVLSLTGEKPVLLREGGVAREDLEAFLGFPLESRDQLPLEERVSPGLMESHYAPGTPFFLVSSLDAYRDDPETGVLYFGVVPPVGFSGPVEVLSADGDPREAAVNLYAALRRLDSLGLPRLVSSLLPEKGVGAAVNDRMRKAAGRNRF